MGFMTEISFLNDRWHEIKESIKKDPDRFVDEIQVLMNGKPVYGLQDENGRREYKGREIPGEGRLGINASFTMYPSHHADDARLYLSYRNAFRSLDKYDIEKQFGARLDNPDDHLLDVLEEEILKAERMLKDLKGFLREKRNERQKIESLKYDGPGYPD
jgi:hypothetical protein